MSGNSPEIELAVLQAALEAVADAVAITDRDGKIEWLNRAFTSLTGYVPAEAVGRNMRILNSGAHGSAFYAEMWRTVLEGGVWRGFVRNRRKDGSAYVTEMSIRPVRDHVGEICRMICVSCAKAPLSPSEPLPADRTEEFALMAESTVHELDDLLTVIRASSESRLARSEARGEDSEDLRMIGDATSRAASLVRRLLEFGRETPKAATTDLNEAIQAGLPRLTGMLPANITLTHHLEPCLVPVKGSSG